MASVPLSGITIMKGAEYPKLYQFNTRTAKHYFCTECGVYTHHQWRSNPEQSGVNEACLDGINPLKLAAIPVNDRVNRPADREAGANELRSPCTIRLKQFCKENKRLMHRWNWHFCPTILNTRHRSRAGTLMSG